MDSFGWGKTRKVVSEDASSIKAGSDDETSNIEEKVAVSISPPAQIPVIDRVSEVMDAEKQFGG
jgi:hypothetical protein